MRGFPHDPRTGRPVPPDLLDEPPLPGPAFHGVFAGPGGFPPGFASAPKVRRGDVRAAALALLAERPRNGYQIIQEITERSQGIWRPSPGSVYPALQQLEDEGLVLAEEDAGRRVYRLTDDGNGYVTDHRKELTEPWAAVAESVSDVQVDLRLLLGQVAMAMKQVVQVGTPHQHDQARRVLAGARRALYRILADGDDAGADMEEEA
jgi:DNA-binding PadR family transcriptional regulator